MRQRWILATALLGTLTVAAAINLLPFLSDACMVAGRRVAMKQAGSVGCFEFWLFRYQSLLAAVLTAFIAAFVAWPVFKQYGLTERLAANELVSLVERRAAGLKELVDILSQAPIESPHVLRRFDQTPNPMRQLDPEFERHGILDQLSQTFDGDPFHDVVVSTQVIAATDELREALKVAHDCVEQRVETAREWLAGEVKRQQAQFEAADRARRGEPNFAPNGQPAAGIAVPAAPDEQKAAAAKKLDVVVERATALSDLLESRHAELRAKVVALKRQAIGDS